MGSYSRVKVINSVPVVKAVCPNQVADGFIGSSAIVVATVRDTAQLSHGKAYMIKANQWWIDKFSVDLIRSDLT